LIFHRTDPCSGDIAPPPLVFCEKPLRASVLQEMSAPRAQQAPTGRVAQEPDGPFTLI
jgi:hypothetical protein